MFFPERITSIRPSDKVLEIGPGASPHPRANAFLEYRFADAETAMRQRGNVRHQPEFGGRPITYYDGDRFPYDDNAFDYVIASHVVEHTSDPNGFMAEVFRVGGGRGYLEFPLPPYEYLYDLTVHVSYVWFDTSARTLFYVRKERTRVDEYAGITSALRRALELGWDDLVRTNLNFFMQGFEFDRAFAVQESPSLGRYRSAWDQPGHTIARRLARKVERLFTRKGA